MILRQLVLSAGIGFFYLSLSLGFATAYAALDSIQNSGELSGPAAHIPTMPLETDLLEWLMNLRDEAQIKLRLAISPPGALAGAIQASPSRSYPDYFFHWVRDSALVQQEAISQWVEAGPDTRRRAVWEKRVWDTIRFSRALQLSVNPSGRPETTGLGEPKFNMDGSPYTLSWGRPQNDGPALRALSTIRWAWILLTSANSDQVRELYNVGLPARTIIKADLEYTAHHWRTPNFDLWEEVSGMHFYTMYSQMRALEEGAILARTLGDTLAADFYEEQARLISVELEKFWDPVRGYILCTLRGSSRDSYKPSQLDTAVVLAALHAGPYHPTWGIFSPRMEATVRKLNESFDAVYKIAEVRSNRKGESMGTPIGRYPEDTYDGVGTNSLGNPWYLTTAALGEYHFLRAHKLMRSDPVRGEREAKLGGSFVRRIQYHTPVDLALAEQYSRWDGYAMGAVHLTWSYASMLSMDRALRTGMTKPIPVKR